MPNPKTTWTVGGGDFIAIYGTLSVPFDPVTAFAL